MTNASPELAWFEKADQDLEMAHRALGPGNPLPGMACYHAHQCAEKYMKGYLVARSVPFGCTGPSSNPWQLCESVDWHHWRLEPGFLSPNSHSLIAANPMMGGAAMNSSQYLLSRSDGYNCGSTQ